MSDQAEARGHGSHQHPAGPVRWLIGLVAAMGTIALVWVWSSYLFHPSLPSLSGARLGVAVVTSVVVGLLLGTLALLPRSVAAVAAGALAVVAIYELVMEGPASGIGSSEITWVVVGLLAFTALRSRD